MKRLIPVGFTALLVMASLAGARTEPSASVQVPPISPAADCAKTFFAVPEVTERSGNPACGACSVSVCQGAEDGTICGFRNGEILYCRPTGPLCQDGLPVADFRCTCTSSIVP